MEPWQLELGYVAARYWWAVFAAICLPTLAAWRFWIRTRYLSEALERRERVAWARLIAHIESLLKIFFDAPPPTLLDLANDTERPFTLKP